MDARYQCAGCGERNDTLVDDSPGRVQSYLEDCQVYCKPNVLHVSYEPDRQEFLIVAALE